MLASLRSHDVKTAHFISVTLFLQRYHLLLCDAASTALDVGESKWCYIGQYNINQKITECTNFPFFSVALMATPSFPEWRKQHYTKTPGEGKQVGAEDDMREFF